MTIDRPALRRALLDAAPWLAARDHGPQAVTAGVCDRCREWPRLLPTCGPTPYEALCRECAFVEGDDAWCDGHQQDGVEARAWAARLPRRWGDLVIAWWIATGEIRATSSPSLQAPDELPSTVRAVLTTDRKA